MDFYFLVIKIVWILDNVVGVCEWVECGEFVFGMVDIWLIWYLIGGSVYVIDVINVV